VWSGVVMLKKHSMLSTWAFLLEFFLLTAKLLTVEFSSDGQVPLKQFFMDNPTRCTTWPPRVQSVTHVKTALLEASKPFLGCSFSNGVFSIDGTNVSDDLCSFGGLIEHVKKKVSEMFIFLNLTVHSFGPESFVPLVRIRKFPKRFDRGKRKL
jgi:hypothetical protein